MDAGPREAPVEQPEPRVHEAERDTRARDRAAAAKAGDARARLPPIDCVDPGWRAI